MKKLSDLFGHKGRHQHTHLIAVMYFTKPANQTMAFADQLLSFWQDQIQELLLKSKFLMRLGLSSL